MPLFVELKISSFQYSVGGEHFYASFAVHYTQKHENDKTELRRQITSQREADYLNAKDGNDPHYYYISVGDMTTRFNTEEQVWQQATKVFPSLFGETAILYMNDPFEVDCPMNGKYWDDNYIPLYKPTTAMLQGITDLDNENLRRIAKSLGLGGV